MEAVYVICDTFKEKSIKNAERRLCGSTQQNMLKRLDIKLPAEMASFLNGSKKKIFNLIETALIQDKIKVGSKMMFFSNTNHCSNFTQNEMSIIPHKSSNHEKVDIKLVVLTGNASI